MSELDFSNINEEQLQMLQSALTPKMTKYIPITPTPKQTAALLMNNVRELLYGGASWRRQVSVPAGCCFAVCRCSWI